MASRWLPVLVWAGVIFAVSSIPSLNSGFGTWDHVLRKGAHMTEYAILAVLLVRATGSYLWAFVFTVSYAATDEVHQLFVRGRVDSNRYYEAEYVDRDSHLVSNTSGGGLFRLGTTFYF